MGEYRRSPGPEPVALAAGTAPLPAVPLPRNGGASEFELQMQVLQQYVPDGDATAVSVGSVGSAVSAGSAGSDGSPAPVAGRRLRREDHDAPLGTLPVAPWQLLLTVLAVLLDLSVAGFAGWLALPGRPLQSLGFAAGFVAALAGWRVYEHRFLGHAEEFRRVATAGVAALAAAGVLTALAGPALRGLVLMAAPVAGLGVLAAHLAARQLLHHLRRGGHCGHRVLLVGRERSVAELTRSLRRAPEAGLFPVGACIESNGAVRVEELPVFGAPADAVTAIRVARADTVLLTAWSDVSEQDLRRLSWALEGSRVQLIVAPRLAEVAVPRLDLQNVAGQPLLRIHEPEFTGVRRVAKGLLDLALGLVALGLLAPVMLAVAIAVKLDSPGPVLFRQERVGKHGRTFRMTKFRSMYVDAERRLADLTAANEHGGGPLFKMRQDPRVTPVGRVIRRFSLDELPQLFDVLCRRMSLVGPRPPLPREVAAYEQDVHRRLLVKPGITGLWQVSGRSDLSWAESVRLDLSYVENWSLGLDLSIIARTVVAVLARRGAY